MGRLKTENIWGPCATGRCGECPGSTELSRNFKSRCTCSCHTENKKPATQAHIMAWLNGRVTGTIRVVHKGKSKVLWTVVDAISDGMTIEDAVVLFCRKNKIDLKKESGV